MTSTADLSARRLVAARATNGSSSLVIHRMLVQAASGTIDPGAKLLEFGAGTGSLITMLRRSGFHGPLTGADILPRPEHLDGDSCWITGDLNDPLPVADGSFDAIVSTEVIEHLENPRAVFREFQRLLQTGGALLLTTPNQESVRSLLSLVLRGHHVAFLDGSYPAHMTALVRTDLVRLCADHGFEAPQFRYTNDGGVPGAPFISWQQISAGLLTGRWFSDNLAMIARKRP